MKRVWRTALACAAVVLTSRRSLVLPAVVLLAGAVAAESQLMSSAFEHRGQLPADHALSGAAGADLEFRLFDASRDGNQVGPAVTLSEVPLKEGSYSVQLDFGFLPFDGDARWISVAARSAAASQEALFTPAGPRQYLSAVPYAMSALTSYAATTASQALTAGGAEALVRRLLAESLPVAAVEVRARPVVSSGAKPAEAGATRDSGAVVGPNGSQFVHELTVAPGESIAVGDVVSMSRSGLRRGYVPFFEEGVESFPFAPGGASWVSAADLGPGRAIVAYNDLANFHFGTTRVARVGEQGITYGAPAVFNRQGSPWTSVAALSESTFVVVYFDGGNAGSGTARIGVVAPDDSISYGAPVVFSPATAQTGPAINNAEVCALSPSSFAVAFYNRDQAASGLLMTGTVSGSAITFGLPAEFDQDIPPGDIPGWSTRVVSLACLSPSSMVVAYRERDNGLAHVRHATLSGGPVALGAPTVFSPNTVSAAHTFSVAPIDSGSFFFAIEQSQLYATVGTVSGSVVGSGDFVPFGTSGSGVKAAVVGPGSYALSVASGSGQMMLGQFTGNSVQVPHSILPLSDSGITYLSRPLASGLTAAFADGIHSRVGKMTLPALATEPVGVAQTAGTAGESIPVIVSGVSDVHAGLVPGVKYSTTKAGDLVNRTGGVTRPVGVALSSTELLLTF